MDYQEYVPKPPLRALLECFWLLEDDSTTGHDSQRILPDGCAEIVLQLGDPFERLTRAGPVRQPECFLYGQLRRHILIRPTGRVRTLGIRFRPGGAASFLGLSLSELTQNTVDLDLIWTSLAAGLRGRVDPGASCSRLFAVVEGLLAGELSRARTRRRGVPESVKAIIERRGQLSIDRLAERAGLSVRQLERRFLREVGLGPKTLSRIVRFQSIFPALQRGESGWAEIAADCGYFDQAHMIREFSAFSGLTPDAHLREESRMSDFFTSSDRMSTFYNTGRPRTA